MTCERDTKEEKLREKCQSCKLLKYNIRVLYLRNDLNNSKLASYPFSSLIMAQLKFR